MSYPIESTNKQINTLLLPVFESALMIEELVGQYLKPYADNVIYDQYSPFPVLSFENTYLTSIDTILTQIQLTVEANVLTGKFLLNGILMQMPLAGRLIYCIKNHHTGKGYQVREGVIGKDLRTTPNFPVKGLEILKGYFDYWLQKDLKWVKVKKTFSDIMEQYLREEYCSAQYLVKEQVLVRGVFKYRPTMFDTYEQQLDRNLVLMDHATRQENEVLSLVREQVIAILHPLLCLTKEFIGNDNWFTYDIKSSSDLRDLVIVKTGDYRIADWMNKFSKNY